MCGIAGAMIFEVEKMDLTFLWNIIEKCNSRGKDSFGIIIWNEFEGWIEYKSFDNNTCACKKLIDNYCLKGLSIIIHTSRAEPTTEWKAIKSNQDIPPFRNDNYGVCHNGIISNDHDLAELHKIKRISNIDTAIMPDLIEREGPLYSLNSIRGGAAFGIIDARKNSLILCRNFMPLFIGWSYGVIAFASELNFFPDYDLPFSDWHLWDIPHYSIIELSQIGYKGPINWDSKFHSFDNMQTKSYSKSLKYEKQ
jgi:glucosamine 6-phosphate synthetase-like amidotransferase/phosphosugar isomerase protein